MEDFYKDFQVGRNEYARWFLGLLNTEKMSINDKATWFKFILSTYKSLHAYEDDDDLEAFGSTALNIYGLRDLARSICPITIRDDVLDAIEDLGEEYNKMLERKPPSGKIVLPPISY